MPKKTAAPADQLNRIGLAIEQGLLDKFDGLIRRRGYVNRSEAFRDLVRAALVEDQGTAGNRDVVGTLTILYEHDRPNLSDKLTEFQHLHHHVIVSTMHVHLDHDNCVEVVVLRGKSKDVRQVADRMIATKGVLFGRLVVAEPRM